jgi:hypothetical protein
VLSRTNIEEIIKFAHKEELFIFADEVRKNQNTKCILTPFVIVVAVLTQ